MQHRRETSSNWNNMSTECALDAANRPVNFTRKCVSTPRPPWERRDQHGR